MMRMAAAVMLISALLFSALAGVLFISSVAAYLFYAYFPTQPDTSPLLITVQSPIPNQTCSSSDIWLNFTITKPETWFRLFEGDEYFIVGKITSAYYCLDGVENKSIPINDSSFFDSGRVHNPQRTVGVSLNLKLPDGTHSITVSAEGESYYANTMVYTAENATATIPAGTTVLLASHSTVAVCGASEVITFSVAKETEPEPFPVTWAAAPVAIAATGAAALAIYYFTRAKKQHKTSSK